MPTLTRDAHAIGAGAPGPLAAREPERDGSSVAVLGARRPVGGRAGHGPALPVLVRTGPAVRADRGALVEARRRLRAPHLTAGGRPRPALRPQDELLDGVWSRRAVGAVRVAADPVATPAGKPHGRPRAAAPAIPARQAARPRQAHPGDPGACGAQDVVEHSIPSRSLPLPGPANAARRRPSNGPGAGVGAPSARRADAARGARLRRVETHSEPGYGVSSVTLESPLATADGRLQGTGRRHVEGAVLSGGLASDQPSAHPRGEKYLVSIDSSASEGLRVSGVA